MVFKPRSIPINTKQASDESLASEWATSVWQGGFSDASCVNVNMRMMFPTYELREAHSKRKFGTQILTSCLSHILSAVCLLEVSPLKQIRLIAGSSSALAFEILLLSLCANCLSHGGNEAPDKNSLWEEGPCWLTVGEDTVPHGGDGMVARASLRQLSHCIHIQEAECWCWTLFSQSRTPAHCLVLPTFKGAGVFPPQ